MLRVKQYLSDTVYFRNYVLIYLICLKFQFCLNVLLDSLFSQILYLSLATKFWKWISVNSDKMYNHLRKQRKVIYISVTFTSFAIVSVKPLMQLQKIVPRPSCTQIPPFKHGPDVHGSVGANGFWNLKKKVIVVNSFFNYRWQHYCV